MRRFRRRPMYYNVSMLNDGTILWALPIRKPSSRLPSEYRPTIDPDGVADEWASNGQHLRDPDNETRTRFQDIVATSLNTRRAIRDLALPALAEVLTEVRSLHERLERIEGKLPNTSAP